MAERTKYLITRSVSTKIINFLNNSGGTRRSSLSFKVNKIIFLLAIYKKKIIGCIPLEPRNFKFDKKIEKVYFITNAYIKKEFQNLGIGSNLIRLFKKKINNPIFAFRLIKNDQTSKWYKKNNFKKIFDIFSYELETKNIKKLFNKKGEINQKFIRINISNSRIWKKIQNLRNSNFLNNYHNFLFSNYYKNFYIKKFFYVNNVQNIEYFVFLVLTKLGDNIFRFEIIDNNLNDEQLKKFLTFFINTREYKKIKKLRIKVIKKNKIKLSLRRYFKKMNYQSSLSTNLKEQINDLKFNQIEYV